MFNIRIWYDNITFQKNVSDGLVINLINCGKTIGFTLDNRPIEEFITVFVTNVVFQNVGLSLITELKKIKFDFEHRCPSWIKNFPWYNTKIFHNSMVHLLKIMLQLQEKTDII